MQEMWDFIKKGAVCTAPRGLLADQCLENGQTSHHGIVADAVAQPQISGPTEVGTGHQQQIVFHGPLRKRFVIAAGCLQEQVEGTFRFHNLIAVRTQRLQKGAAVAVVNGQIRL